MFLRREAERQDLGQGVGFAALRRDHVNEKIVAAEFPHHLTAHAAGRERPGDDAVLSAAHGDGGKVPVSVVDRLEEGGALGADRGAVGRVFDVAALIHRPVGAQQRRAHLIAGVGDVGMGHGLSGKLTQFFGCHGLPPYHVFRKMVLTVFLPRNSCPRRPNERPAGR